MLALVLAESLKENFTYIDKKSHFPKVNICRQLIYLCASLGPPVQDGLPVLVHLQLDDGDLAGVDADVGGGTVGLLPLDTLNVDPKKNMLNKVSMFGRKIDSPELGPVALKDLADLLALVVTSHHLHLVVLPHRHGSDSILGPQLLGEGGRHEAAPGYKQVLAI